MACQDHHRCVISYSLEAVSENSIAHILLDADRPLIGMEQKPHMGWEIYESRRQDGPRGFHESPLRRVFGPGHIWFPPKTDMMFWRIRGLNVNEVETGQHMKQIKCGAGRIDAALRLFKHGGPGDGDARDDYPAAFGRYPRPSFGHV